MLFSSGWVGRENIMDDVTNRQVTNSLKFHMLTDMSVARLPDCIQGHQLHLYFMQSAQFMICHFCGCLSTVWFWQPPNTSLVPNISWKFIQQLQCSVSFKETQTLVKIWYSLMDGMFTNVEVMCKNTPFLLAWKSAKSIVSKPEVWC